MVLSCNDLEFTFYVCTGSSVMNSLYLFLKCTLHQVYISFLLSFKTEIKRMSVFKNYEPGEPTCRLYVKNIAKQVEEKVGTFIALDPLWFRGYDAYSGVFIYS